jgi:hypothetical protein
MATRIAIMQPYFLPYAGYFRLMCDVDAFVIYDDVQFMKGGWVHRNRLRRHDGTLGWLTLPLKRAPLNTRINEMTFAPGHQDTFAAAQRRFPLFARHAPEAGDVIRSVGEITGSPCDYIIKLLLLTAEVIGLRPTVIRSSNLTIPPELKNADRVYDVCRQLGAAEYVNAPSGRALYSEAEFDRRGIKLTFLPDYRGGFDSILQRIADQPTGLLQEIRTNCR